MGEGVAKEGMALLTAVGQPKNMKVDLTRDKLQERGDFNMIANFQKKRMTREPIETTRLHVET